MYCNVNNCPLTLCVMQAPETLGGGSSKGRPGESLFGSCDLSLSKNQDDSVCHGWCSFHGGYVSGPGEWKNH